MTKNLDLARAAYGAALPAWLECLAIECDRSSQQDVAKQLRYSGTVVNQVLAGKYNGSLGAVESAFKGAFQAASVNCPVVGEIALQVCMEHQRAPFANTNPMRTRLYRACRGKCPHSRINKETP